MRARGDQLQSLAARIVEALLAQGYVHPKKGDPAALQARIVAIIVQNMEEEQELEKEAERLAATHARQMVGMDQRRIIMGIKERLAKERGFSL